MLNIKITDSDFIGGSPAYLDTVSRYAARGVLFNSRGQVAMMHMAELDLYKLPGGGMEEGESPEEAFVREIKEETGCDAEVIRRLGYVEEHKNRNGFLQHSHCYLAKARHVTGTTSLTAAEEQLGMSVQWLSAAQALDIMGNAVAGGSDNHAKLFMLMRDRAILKEAVEFMEKEGFL
ncbi:NUDIX domain-containing protein [Paenibacillus sp. BK033]|uniref:NUDIX hydrolase n=1 Tax=Paenibacillus sp. BK033 TaxID=2512133 RepID=UPI001053CBEC|nr:NUDIX domain-containing protein [Paenibacillus sp. BK033]TCM86208.1 NUDIX domain-containing protein [Paenibacillus sp. BK033]